MLSTIQSNQKYMNVNAEPQQIYTRSHIISLLRIKTCIYFIWFELLKRMKKE